MYKKYKIPVNSSIIQLVTFQDKTMRSSISSVIIVPVLSMAKPLPIVIFGLKTKLTSVRYVYVTGQNL